MPAKDIDQLCKRCNALEAALTVRAEPLCRECFAKYIHTKVIKRMTAFQTRHAGAGQERRLLLPMSFGVSSVTLLHILERHLQTQMQKTGRTGFSLHILHIKSPLTSNFDTRFANLKDAHPDHQYSTADLEDLFEDKSTLETILLQLPSASSVADVTSVFRTRLAVRFAREHECEGILWSHSTTKLAETILAETAKGRGFSLPWQVLDGPSPYGVDFYYPLRDVLKKELISHAKICEPSLLDLIDPKAFETTAAPPSAKNTTIDVLMKQYFEDVEETYPSIVSNVVRTAGKLVVPDAEKITTAARCRLCQMPVGNDRMGIAGWGGHQEDDSEDVGSKHLCYGCSRSLPAEAISLLP